ncbi:MAG: ankyrin repeat domain-containing protein, partial [Alphaproteobacteria bacterium]|nr:ankyrin repeat domain-containing protein [Alphaproteobacteria bacterium]
VMKGEWDKVRESLKAHPELKDVKFSASKGDGTTHEDMTLMHMLALRGQTALAEEVLGMYGNEDAKKAAINAQDSRGNTPLHLMLSGKNPSTEMIQLLQSNGADVNKTNNLGNTPLHIAAGMGHTESAKLLIAAGAKVAANSKDGTTPLHIAANPEIAKLLIEANKEALNQRDANGSTALHTAISDNRLDVADTLLGMEGVDINARDGKDQKGKTPLDMIETQMQEEGADKKGLQPLREKVVQAGGKTAYALDYHRDVEIHTYETEAYKHAEKRDKNHRNKYVPGVKKYLNDERRQKAMDNLTYLYRMQGYPEEEAKKQARVMMYKLVQANLLYHPDEKIKGDKRTLTEMFTMNHRTVLDHLLVQDFSQKSPEEREKYMTALGAIEEAISPDGFAIKPVYVTGKMSYDPTRTSGYRTEKITVDTKTNTRVGADAVLRESQAPVEEAKTPKPTVVRSYDAAVYSNSQKKVSGFRNKKTVAGIRLTTERQETALKNITSILMTQGYTEQEAKKQAYVLLAKLEQLSLQCSSKSKTGGKKLEELLGFNHDALLKKLVAGEIDPSEYATVLEQLSVVESRVSVKGTWVKNPEPVRPGQTHPSGYVEKPISRTTDIPGQVVRETDTSTVSLVASR